MPAIRATSWNYTRVANGSVLDIPVPASLENDLLLAIIMADTGTGTWTAPAATPAWTQLTGFPTTNTAQITVFYKLASATEATSYTFTRSATESFNGCIISIRDVNTTNPFGSPIVTAITNQAAAAKVTMSQITTNVNDALIIYAFANSSAGVPSLLEGPVTSLVAADGLAESLGVGWGFKRTAGLTPNNVVCSNIVTGAGVKITLQIAPPSTGATIIPAYVYEDRSVYIDPINGTSAYNGNTAIAATADTNYGTTLGGRTAADAGIAAATDVGLNSFHSVARVTSISNSRNLAGVELVLVAANRLNVQGKNILCHIGPSTEGQTQRFSSIAQDLGAWFGMRSNTAAGGATTGYKIWQVYGVEKGSLRQQPIIINSQSTTTIATSGTLDDTVVTSFGFWIAGQGVLTTIWDFASLWLIDTTTIVGGNAAEPVDIPQIGVLCGLGKERKSTIQQGSRQLISYQPLQFGNAGTDTTYLRLNATAIEFPTQYNQILLESQYNSINNYVGITYDAGPNDTILHTNSSVSSDSPFHWRFDPGFSTASTYSFVGTRIIGAGDIQLIPNLILEEVGFNRYDTINATGTNFIECEFINLPNTSTAVTINASTTFDTCEIDTTDLSPGVSFVKSSSPSQFENCSFIGSTTTGHAIEITSTGTYNFSGNIFTGYGGIGGSNTVTNSGSTSAAIYNNSGGLVTLNILNNGTGPSVRNGAGASTIISNPQTFVVRNIQPGTELRLFTQDTLTELAGAEVVGPIPSGLNNLTVEADDLNSGKYKVTYAYEYTSDIPIFIVAHSLAYQWLRQNAVIDANGGDTSIVQLIDRQYNFGTSP
jgi:hypothetical protein